MRVHVSCGGSIEQDIGVNSLGGEVGEDRLQVGKSDIGGGMVRVKVLSRD